jgi:hypothetical protein
VESRTDESFVAPVGDAVPAVPPAALGTCAGVAAGACGGAGHGAAETVVTGTWRINRSAITVRGPASVGTRT